MTWIFGTNPIDPAPAGPDMEGEISETLFICSDLGATPGGPVTATQLIDPLVGTCEAEKTAEVHFCVDPVQLTICHGGRSTITVSTNALPVHLQHGDTSGPCE